MSRTTSRLLTCLLMSAGFLCAVPVDAEASPATRTQTFSGSLSDPSNVFLQASDGGQAQFGDLNAIANNVAIYTLNLGVGGLVSFDSMGAATGGLMPYFSLFKGKGQTATFLDSNYASTGADVHLHEILEAGVYSLALGSNQNMSWAENIGQGTLGDGFIGLGDPSTLGNASYRFTVSSPVDEPPVWALLPLAAFLLNLNRRRQRR